MHMEGKKFLAAGSLLLFTLGSGAALAHPEEHRPAVGGEAAATYAVAKIRGTDRLVRYQVVDGDAMLDDMILGRHEDVQRNGLPSFEIAGWTDVTRQGGIEKDLASRSARRWPNNTLYYAFDSSFPQSGRTAALAGMKLISDAAGIKFVQRTNQTNYVLIHQGGGCSSYVGMIGGAQRLSLASGCWYAAIAAHELMHALGWKHEQMRPDRNNYVIYHPENVQSGMGYNFTQVSWAETDSAGGYDYDSVMHYGAYAFSKNGRMTLEPRNGVDPRRLGQRRGLSSGDGASLRKFYPPRKDGFDFGVSSDTQELIVADAGGVVTLDLENVDAATAKVTFESDAPGALPADAVEVLEQRGNQLKLRVAAPAGSSQPVNVAVVVRDAAGRQGGTVFTVSHSANIAK